MTTVLVLGLGESGLAMARWSARQGAAVRVWDSRAEPPQAAGLAAHVPGATRLPAAALTAADLAGIDRVLKSPGLAPHDAGIAALLAAAAKAGVPVEGELDVFADALEGLRTSADYLPKVITVTGTNGKTTTTVMTALLVGRSGRRVAVAGNIGPTMLQTLADAIDAGPAEALRDRLPEVWVLELSSFQLDGVARFEADAAAVLNVTEDHLDWHGSMAAYAAAKARVFGHRAVVVLNRDDPAAMKLLPPAQTVATKKGRPPRVVPRRVVEFGAGAPERPGDWGLAIDNDMAWLVRARDDDVSPRDLTLQHLMPADALRIRGRHNALNALAALALASAIGCPLAPMLHALREYRGEPHRVEFVAGVDGVDAFDDSKGTNVGATVAALDGLGADRAPGKLVVILGGDGKGQDFAPLAAPLARRARAVLTLGRDAGQIEAAIASSGVPFERCATLEAAVEAAFARAGRGDAVLLSPACASLDMFRNYAHRAEVFVAAVRAHAEHKGGVA
ncbi:MAG: UDP-N-acetylmuramoyl-L-alanine--D-glutamate ligase [Burkholderiales bacterium]|nr:UDP-N-acetylmuramoyl-L-alanine--D-glutamate ligase [Burkholderiales bacterium]